jgi:hypothetical protein
LDQLSGEHFEKIAERYPLAKLATIVAGQARECGYTVCDDPSDFLPGHVVVCPPRDAKINQYIKMAKRLALCSAMYRP